MGFLQHGGRSAGLVVGDSWGNVSHFGVGRCRRLPRAAAAPAPLQLPLRVVFVHLQADGKLLRALPNIPNKTAPAGAKAAARAQGKGAD